MIIKPLKDKINIKEQEIKGFTVIEWGGTILK